MEEIEEWGMPILGLLEEFRDFIIGIREKKRRLGSKKYSAPTPAPGETPANPYATLYKASEEHYEEVVAMFDRALDAILTSTDVSSLPTPTTSSPIRRSDTVYAQVFCLESEDEEEGEEAGQGESALGAVEGDWAGEGDNVVGEIRLGKRSQLRRGWDPAEELESPMKKRGKTTAEGGPLAVIRPLAGTKTAGTVAPQL